MILVIDDNAEVARAIALACVAAGYDVDIAASPAQAFSMLSLHRYDVILLDLNFTPGETSGAEGLSCLSRIVADDPMAAIVVITAHSGIKIAVAAMQAGALDFVMKPWRNADLIARVEAAIAKRKRPTTPLPAAKAAAAFRLLGDSPQMTTLRNLVRRVAPTMASMLILGPPGSGRKLVATLVHEASQFADEQAVFVDVRNRADWDQLDSATGTLVLRHADSLDDVAQSQILGRLPEKARLIAIAETNRKLSAALRARIGTIELRLPPLAERGQDALILARHFAIVASERYGRFQPKFTASAEAFILATRWRDEVRELELTVERAVLLNDEGIIDSIDLMHGRSEEPPVVVQSTSSRTDTSLEESERVLIQAALAKHRYNIRQAAESLGLSRQALYRRMARYGY